jgi:hypothetical protein
MKDNEICITQASVPYSFFNVNQSIGNSINFFLPLGLGGGTVGTIGGAGTSGNPWTANITLMTSTTGIVVGSPLSATAGTGTLYGGLPTSAVVTAILSPSSISYAVVGGTTPTGGTVTDIIGCLGASPLTITSGFYTVSDINLFFQNYCVTNKLYTVNSSGQNVYFLAFFINTTYYSNQIVFTTIPTAAQAVTLGWTVPSGATWTFPSVSTNPNVSFESSGSISSLLGFSPSSSYTGTGTAGGASSSELSTITPLGSSVNSIIVRSNIVNNNVGNPSDILDSFPINAVFGANINYSPSFAKWVKVADGTYSQFTLLLTNELLQPINAQDNRSLFTMLIRKVS